MLCVCSVCDSGHGDSNSEPRVELVLFLQAQPPASGQKTSMEPAFAQMLYQDPDKFTEDAYSAHHDRFFHASEFTWVENGQNLWEWMIIRNRFVDKSRDRQKCK